MTRNAFQYMSSENIAKFEDVVLDVKNRLPWLLESHLNISPDEGYAPGVFGSRAGTSDNITAYNLLHEISHAFEIMDSEPLKWKDRLAKDNFGMKIKTYATVMGIRYYEPNTMQATLRECRVGGVQKFLTQQGGWDTSDFNEEFIQSLVYMSDSLMGGSSILNSHEPEKYSDGNKQWVKVRSDAIDASFKSCSLGNLKEKWILISSFLENLEKRRQREQDNSSRTMPREREIG